MSEDSVTEREDKAQVSTVSSETGEGGRLRPYLILKFVVEWLLALGLLIMSLGPLVVLALAVKLTSRGPAFYTQTRLGYRGRTFHIIKLRTMFDRCEAVSGPVWSLPGDSRVTPLGRILRDTHLDELPQLFNVLMGHMGLVGPRPERPEISERIERVMPEFRMRLKVRPGVTGLAQMRLPADTNLEGVRLKLAHDLYYLSNISPLLDLRVAFSTAFYFLATVANAVCVALVSSYGRAVERSLPRAEASSSDAFETGVAEA